MSPKLYRELKQKIENTNANEETKMKLTRLLFEMLVNPHYACKFELRYKHIVDEVKNINLLQGE